MGLCDGAIPGCPRTGNLRLAGKILLIGPLMAALAWQ
jgi:hypothetical protein